MAGDRGWGPVLGAIALSGAALVLTAGLYAAQKFGKETDDKKGAPEIGLWADEANDRVNVVSGDPDARWSDITIEGSVPLRYSLGGHVWSPAVEPGDGHTMGREGIVGGQSLLLCAIEGDAETVVTMRDAASDKVLFQEKMQLGRCLQSADIDLPLDIP